MHRRPVGRSRVLAAIGSIVIIVGCFLPWFTRGGEDGLPVLTGNAFASFGILVFVAAVATLALVTLPYASERPVAADRWTSYALITAVGWLGYALRLFDLLTSRAFHFAEPAQVITNIPGLWLAGIGLVVLSRAAYEMLQEPRLR